jgi:type III polyketide synthase
VVASAFENLTAQLPQFPPDHWKPTEFDWAVHPGGISVLRGAELALGLAHEHMRASHDIYTHYGNSSSATIYSILDRLHSRTMDATTRSGHGREYIVGCAFGPGIALEMCILQRNMALVR